MAVYLAAVVACLNTDPWPRDTRFAGPTLTPAAIERKLRIVSVHNRGEQVVGADDLVRQCVRLVVTGGPGSGKTWLARRTARLCAKAALDALAAGAGLDEVELPLYTTCARLAAVPSGDGIRRAIVKSALGLLPDLGGARILDALQVLFEQREAPTLLVADSLDEACGADERVRQADTLAQRWRIVLTTRPSSWDRQLVFGDDDPSRRVGVLQALRYPDDVEPFFAAWFCERSEWAASLAAQLRNRPDLQQAATVPLILTFFCILGGDQPLPGRRADLYAKVIRRMLTGRWRRSGDHDPDPDPDACLETLRGWAWSTADSNPVSGVGHWADEVPTPRVRQSRDDRDALDHVAVPLGPPDPDTGATRRRFVHRSLQEHLVAEHVALQMPADEAAGELLNHLWYDPDWEYAAPAALAMHPRHDQILKDLICRAAKSEQMPRDLSVIDGGWEFRRFLARVASESGQWEWGSGEIAEIIGQARVQLATSGRTRDIGGAVSWETSNRQVREALIEMLARETDSRVAEDLACALGKLDPTDDDKRHACDALLELMRRATESGSSVAETLVTRLIQLFTAQDKRQACGALLDALAREPDGLAAKTGTYQLAQLDPTDDDKRQARDALLRLLAQETDCRSAAFRVDGIVQLGATAEDKRHARDMLLRLLAHETNGFAAALLPDRIAQLGPTDKAKRRACSALLRLLADEADDGTAKSLADQVIQLATTVDDKRQARGALLRLLTDRTGSSRAAMLSEHVAQLDPGPEDKRRVCDMLLRLLAHEPNGRSAAGLAEGIAQLDPAPEDKRHAREVLLPLLAHETSGLDARALAEEVVKLDPTREDKSHARDALVQLLASQTSGWVAAQLAGQMARLDPTREDKRQAREALLRLLPDESDEWAAGSAPRMVAQLDPTPEDQRRARDALLGWLGRGPSGRTARTLVQGMAKLDPTPEDKRQARDTLLQLLASPAPPKPLTGFLAVSLAELATTAEDKRRTRDALLHLLVNVTDSRLATTLADVAAQLSPTVRDLSTWRTWIAPPTANLLAAVRQNSNLDSWLETLPSLAPLSGGSL